MDEMVGYINFDNAEDVAKAALRFAREAEKGEMHLIQLVYSLMKKPEPDAAAIERLLQKA